jgi:hypothetical protein
MKIATYATRTELAAALACGATDAEILDAINRNNAIKTIERAEESPNVLPAILVALFDMDQVEVDAFFATQEAR